MIANRLYCAVYYVVSAFLLQNGYSVQTHHGIIQLLGLHFIKTGILEKEYGTLYGQLFSLRQTGDYGDT
ncbi:MAG: HEPN domain-containing protein [Bacteroidales bacterium]|nr:HEPN domain-containing protein [Bacteroidales bacterium]